MDARLQEACEKIKDVARRRGRVLVAYSGGVDSGLVAKIIYDAIGYSSLAVLADTESLSRWEFREAKAQAEDIGIPLRIVFVSELASVEYRQNPSNRCYFCRASLATVLREIAERERYQVIADGIHTSDLGDDRPGIQAMNEAGVWHPLLEMGLAKPDVRAIARSFGLSFHDKPSNACLSSRIPHGTPITVEVLRTVEAAEDYLRNRGFRQVRVRHHGPTARIEVLPEEIPKLQAIHREIEGILRTFGYRETVIDPAGYRARA